VLTSRDFLLCFFLVAHIPLTIFLSPVCCLRSGLEVELPPTRHFELSSCDIPFRLFCLRHQPAVALAFYFPSLLENVHPTAACSDPEANCISSMSPDSLPAFRHFLENSYAHWCLCDPLAAVRASLNSSLLSAALFLYSDCLDSGELAPATRLCLFLQFAVIPRRSGPSIDGFVPCWLVLHPFEPLTACMTN